MGSHRIDRATNGASLLKRSSESQAVMDAIRRIVRELRLAARAAEAQLRISSAQLFVLERLAESPVTSLGQLSMRTLTDQSSVSTVVNRLVEAKLVARKPSAEDRRRVELTLTAAGRAKLKKGPEPAQVRLLAAVDALPEEERRNLARALGKLVRSMGADAGDATMLFEDEQSPKRARKRTDG